ncbi:MAG: hypothetical protein Q9211_005005 [Gyalolechia sp. 1 TL-2023]
MCMPFSRMFTLLSQLRRFVSPQVLPAPPLKNTPGCVHPVSARHPRALGTFLRPSITAAVAVSQLSSPPAFPGPFAPSELVERIPGLSQHFFCNDFNNSVQYLSHLHLQDVKGDRKRGSSRQCYGTRGTYLPKDEVHMSQGPSSSGPLLSQNDSDSNHKRLPPLESRTLPPINDGSMARASDLGEWPALSARPTPVQSPAVQKSSRSLGMQNILNPASKDSSGDPSRRRKADQAGLPSPATTAASRAPSTSMTPSPGTVSLPSITPPSMTTYLPPVSQGPHQAFALHSTSGYPPTLATHAIPGTIDAKLSPFVGSGEPVHTSAPETSNCLDFPSAVPPNGPPYGGGAFPPSRSPTGRQPSSGAQLPISMDRRSSVAGSISPSTTYSSYRQFSRTPPAPQTNAPASQPSSAFFGVPYPAAGHVPSLVHGFGANGPVSSSTAQGPYRMMTMDTEQGPIQVPVDVQAASKVADEKRKRNATASHRFRQRRKEKERETSQNIAKLEKQINEIAEEREFYRLERDYFRALISRNPNQAHLATRPPSPTHHRAPSQTPEHEGVPGAHWQSPNGDRNHSGRNTRRRTSSYVAPQDVPVPPPSMHGFGPQHPQHQPRYLQLQPADLRSEDMQSGNSGRGRPLSSFPPPNHPPTWHPPHR